MHKVIIIPGLGDEVKKIEWATGFWKKYGLEPVVCSMQWKNKEEPFTKKLERLLTFIDQFVAEGHEISLIGPVPVAVLH